MGEIHILFNDHKKKGNPYLLFQNNHLYTRETIPSSSQTPSCFHIISNISRPSHPPIPCHRVAVFAAELKGEGGISA